MKTLAIIRHGKSSWEDPTLSDRQRPLLQKGKNRTKKIGQYLREVNLIADAFISSPAERAKQTAVIIANILEYDIDDILLEEEFYFDGSKAIINTILNFDNQWNTVFIFGHNPDFTSVSKYFSPKENFFYLPTTGTVILDFNINKWKEISPENCVNSNIIFPRNL